MKYSDSAMEIFEELEASGIEGHLLIMVSQLAEDLKAIDYLLHPQLRNSRFDFNARYIRFDEAQQIPEFKNITDFLTNADNKTKYEVGDYVFYRRGTGGIYLYCVPKWDYKVPRERKHHKIVSSEKLGGKKDAVM